FLTEFYTQFPAAVKQELDNEYWQQILLVRAEVNKVLEAARQSGDIGSGLEAQVSLYCGAELQAKLAKLQDELKFVLITSQANLLPLTQAPTDAVATEVPELKILVQRLEDQKCQRCWHRTPDVNQNPQYPHICGRCVENLTVGEQRHFA